MIPYNLFRVFSLERDIDEVILREKNRTEQSIMILDPLPLSC